jgi:hypothetical protein
MVMAAGGSSGRKSGRKLSVLRRWLGLEEAWKLANVGG